MGLEELLDGALVFAGEVAADAHVGHDEGPLGAAVGVGGADVVAAVAGLGPQLGAAEGLPGCRFGLRGGVVGGRGVEERGGARGRGGWGRRG